MINLRRNFYLLVVATTSLLVIATVCVLTENAMDIFFLGASIFSSVITFRAYGKFREKRRLRSY